MQLQIGVSRHGDGMMGTVIFRAVGLVGGSAGKWLEDRNAIMAQGRGGPGWIVRGRGWLTVTYSRSRTLT